MKGFERIVFWGVCAVMFLAPLPFGMTEYWAVYVFEAAVLILWGTYHAGFLWKGRTEENERRRSGEAGGSAWTAAAAGLAGFFFVIVFLQTVPIPGAVVALVSPRAEAVGGAGWRTLSLAPQSTLELAVLWVCVALFGRLLFLTARTAVRVETVVWVIIAAGVFQAFYGLIQYFSGMESIFGYVKEWGTGSAGGTYINRNHFAGFLEMCLPVCLGWLMVKADFFEIKKDMNWRERVLWFGQERLQRSLILIVFAAVMGVGLFFSRSRSGILIFFVSVFLMTALATVRRRGERAGRGQWIRFGRVVKLVAAAVLFAVLMIGARPIIERFSRESMSRNARIIFSQKSWAVARDYPLAGVGLGVFEYVFPRYDDYGVRGLLTHSHNDYVEILAEAGIPGGGSIILAGLLAWGALLGRWLRRRNPMVQGTGLGCLTGTAAIIVHSLTDFNLRIPANAVFFVGLLALGYAAAGLAGKRS